MKKTILILGAGVYQLPLIRKAKELGLKTIVLSCNIKDYPGNALADIALDIDTTDQKRVLEAAKKYKISGVVTTGTDVALKSLGYVNSNLGLCGPSYQACLLSTDKKLMKKRFIDDNVPTAKYYEARDFLLGLEMAKKIGYPVMVKAINSSGSRGVSKAETVCDFKRAWSYSQRYSKGEDPIIIEEFLEGSECGAQAFIHDNKINLLCVHNDTVTSPPYSTPIGHSYPFKDIKIQKEAEETVLKGVSALGLNNSAANVDLMVTKKGVKVLEIGARMGATCLPELTAIHTGVDIYKECIKMALGEKPDFNISIKKPVAGLLIGSNKNGRIKQIKTPTTKNKNIVSLQIDVKVGDSVNKFKIGPDRVGEVIALGADWMSAEENARNFCEQVMIECYEN